MRRRFRQMVAGLLAVMTITATVPQHLVYAAEQPDQMVSGPADDSVMDMPDTGQAAEADSPVDAGQAAEADSPVDTEQAAEADSPVDAGQAAEADSPEDIEQPAADSIPESGAEDGALISFVAVDAGRVEVGGTQNIVVDIGDDSQVITAAALGYHRVSDRSTYEAAAVLISGNGLRFTMDYTAQAQTGEYVLDYLNYTMNGKAYTVRFETAGMDVRYGVGVDVERAPDMEVVDEPESAVDMEVVTFDENGRQTSEQSIADAIAGQQESGVYRARYNGDLVVVLDPGHDATHGGAFQNGLKEHELTLKIAQYCKEELERYAGVTVYMTRTTASCAFGGNNDNCLKSRVNYAQSVGANVFVSLHLNSNDNSSPHGVEVYRPNSNYRPDIHDEAKELAEDILEQLEALGLNNRGTFVRSCQDHTEEYMYPDGSQADYYAVIRYSKRAGIPGMIVEHAFLSNTSDVENFLSTEEKLKQLGVADATGIANYYGLSATGGYSAVFDAEYYAEHNADLKEAFGDDAESLLNHFLSYGMSEGRQGNASFDVYSYRNAYADLRSAFGKDLKQYYLHYVRYGQFENRITSGVDTIENPLTVLDGVDYAAVYDYNYYLKRYPDLKAAFRGDEEAALRHFVTYGMREKRQAKETFDPVSYYNAYGDLRAAFGQDWKSYYQHYMKYGVGEKRTAVGVTTLKNPLTVLNGVDYAAVYDYNYYLGKYSDLKRVYSGDEVGALQHFVAFGMSEKRQAKETFDPISYYNANKDLRTAFGQDWKSYYQHYMKYGVGEKRTAVGVTTLKDPLTVLNGVDYTAVYDYNYYLNKYSDLKRVFSGDERGALQHFVTHGMSEGRQAKSTFDVSIYRSNYQDLQRVFGNDLKSYYMHYINNGVKEERNAVSVMYHNIMGGPTATAAQMARFYNARASYPSFYAQSDAATINDLCQIFYDEAVYEGVDPAVAFCQTILETGWLQFNGDVNIEQYNFAGIGATGGGNPGNSFPSARIGIRAQIQHLKAYATSEPLRQDTVDPRYTYVTKGCAPYVEWLGQKENPNGFGWATGKDYGSKILNLMGQLYTY